MRTVTFKTLRDALAAALNMAPSDVTAVQAVKHVEALNLALRHAWTWPDAGWPELQLSEEITPSSGVIEWDAAAQAIGTVHGIYLDSPDTGEYPRPVRWRWKADGSGVIILDTVTTVWLRYTPQTPEWTSTAYESGQNYPAGTVRYDTTLGDCYIAIAATTSAAVTDTSKWRKLDVPWIFRRAAVRGATALLSGVDGDRGEEQLLENSMGEVLAQEWKQFTRSAGQHQSYGVISGY